MKTFSDLVKISNTSLRDRYVQGEVFVVGEQVKLRGDRNLYQILNRGSNYVTVISENGKQRRAWLTDLISLNEVVEVSAVEKFKPKKLDQHEEWLTPVMESTDLYARYNLLRSLDTLLDGKEITESSFERKRIALERATKYIRKFGLDEAPIYNVSMNLLEFSIMNSLKFTATDKIKVASLIATAVGIGEINTTSPERIVNDSAMKIKLGRLTPEGWKIVGRLFNKATEMGIKWNKDLFAKQTQRFMELA